MIFYWAALLVFALDQATKLLVLLVFPRNAAETSITVIPHFFNLVYRTNTGAAFSLFTGHTLALTIVSAVAVVVIIFWQRTFKRTETGFLLSMGMICGGALGNLFDRVFRGGEVIDFLDFHWFNAYHWPAFNFADTSICTGVGLFMILSFLEGRRAKKNPPEDRKDNNK